MLPRSCSSLSQLVLPRVGRELPEQVKLRRVPRGSRWSRRCLGGNQPGRTQGLLPEQGCYSFAENRQQQAGRRQPGNSAASQELSAAAALSALGPSNRHTAPAAQMVLFHPRISPEKAAPPTLALVGVPAGTAVRGRGWAPPPPALAPRQGRAQPRVPGGRGTPIRDPNVS